MHRRTLVCAALLLLQPAVGMAAVTHHAIGLIPSRLYDVWSNGDLIAEGIASSPAGTMQFMADPVAPLRITLSGVVGDFIPPVPVSTLTVTSTTESSISLRWTAVGDDGNTGQASRYDLRYSTVPISASNWAAASQADGEPAPKAAGQIETFDLGGLAGGMTYYVALKVADEVPNWSGLSNVASGTTLGAGGDAVPPASVTTLTVTSTTENSVSLRWTAVGDDGNAGQAAVYDLRYSTVPINASNWAAASQADGEPAPKTAGQIETFTLGGLTAGTTYHFALKVGDEVPNWSGLSNVPSGTTLEGVDAQPPGPISDLEGYPLSHTMVLLLWTAVGDDGVVGNATAYELRTSMAPIDAQSWDLATPIQVNLSPGEPGHRESYAIGGLAPETMYHFVLRARDEAGNLGPLSPDVAVRTPQVPDATAPATPDSLQEHSEGDRVRLTWLPSTSPDVVDYTLYRRRVTLGDVQERIEFNGVHGVAFADSSVLPNARYAYAIAARDGAGNFSPRSEEVFIDTKMEEFIPEVTDLLAEGSIDLAGPEGSPVVRLNWTANAGRRFAGFIVERSQDVGRTWVTRSPAILPKAESYEFAEEIEPGIYLYRIAALSTRGFARRFDPIPLRWEPGDPEGQVVEGPFPNPSPGPMGLRFHLLEATRVRVVLYDLAGRRLGVLHDQLEDAGLRSWTEASPEASGLSVASGVYFLRIEVGDQATVRKLIVRK